MPEKAGANAPAPPRRQPHRLRLPGFTAGEDTGLGDVIKRFTSAYGIKPCGGCERRAADMNRWIVFTGRDK
jgi:hypothetical protein